MKLKTGIPALFAICALLFFSCDWLFEDTKKENPPKENPPEDSFKYEVGTALTTTKWGQRSPHNDLFPIVDGQRSVTDCGNLALAQIIRFHQYPVRGNGQSTQVRINSDTIIVPTVNFNVKYDWNNMLDNYTTANPGSTQQRNAAATLVYHVSAAVGANTPERSNYPQNYTAALTDIFGFDKSVQIHYRRYYNDNDWEAMIRQQLDLGLPVYYWGNDTDNNHAFVIDGYNNSGLFHINLGWNGRDDGWYSLNNINPSIYNGAGKFYNNNLIIINIKPDAGGMPAGYEMALNSFSANKTIVSQNELLTVTMQIRNISTFGVFSGGQMGVALVNNNNEIKAVIGTANRPALNQLSLAATATINCYIPETINTGNYRLMAVIRETDGEWKVITKSAVGDNIPNAFNLTVTKGEANGGCYGLAFSSFNVDEGRVSASHGDQFNVNYNIRNLSAETFEGSLRAVLIDNTGNETVIGTRSSTSFAAEGGRSSFVACTIPNNATSGNYQLKIAVRPTGGEWKIVTMSYTNIPNSIDFEIQ